MAQRPSLISPQDDWRMDFTLVEELPEDSIIGRNFIGNAVAGLVAAGTLLTLAWSSYDLWSARQGIKDWDARIGNASNDLKEVERLQSEYTVTTDQVDQIHEMMNNPISLTRLVAELGRTLPQIVSLDMIESFDAEIVVRGTLEASSEQASRLIGDYVKGLSDNPVIGPHFSEIKLSGLERFDDEDGLNFEFTMVPNTGDEDA
ncbi:hypothetical protein N9023_02835 [Opitutaceae bacterium]|nr:hypothetical protein [Opitutaceae bacterium]